MRITVRVKPGASRTKVGGCYGEDVLIVAVTAPAVDGRANDAVVKAVADAFALRRSDVTIVSGHTARTKVLELADPNGIELAQLAQDLLQR